jgi:Holliday junction DNA helicase RuvB
MEKFSDFIGNKNVIRLVNLLTHNAEEDKLASLPDMAFLGPAGHGKTSLARLVAKKLDRKIIEINATTVVDPFQFRGYIVNTEMDPGQGTIIFVDECHALKKRIQTNLLSATEHPRKLHTTYKNEIYRDPLPMNYSFIFATTKRSYVIPELYSRLTLVEFEEYSVDEKAEIVISYLVRAHKFTREQFDPSCVVDIAKRSRSARAVVRHCDRIVQNMSKENAKLTKEIIDDTFTILGIDQFGLTRRDRKMLKFLSRQGGAVGLETISDLMQMPKKDVKGDLEPYLLRGGFIARRSAGRMITEAGLNAVNVEAK